MQIVQQSSNLTSGFRRIVTKNFTVHESFFPLAELFERLGTRDPKAVRALYLEGNPDAAEAVALVRRIFADYKVMAHAYNQRKVYQRYRAEAISWLFSGLLEAIYYFKPTGGASFKYFAIRKMVDGYRSFLRETDDPKIVVHTLSAAAGAGSVRDMSLEFGESSGNNNMEGMASRDDEIFYPGHEIDLQKALATLTEKERMVVEQYIFADINLEDQAKAMGLSQQRLNQIYNGALKKMRQFTQED